VLGGNDERMYVRKKGFFLISHCLSTTRYAVLVSLCFFLSILQLYWVVIKLVKSIERNWKSRKWRPLLHLLQYGCNYCRHEPPPKCPPPPVTYAVAVSFQRVYESSFYQHVVITFMEIVGMYRSLRVRRRTGANQPHDARERALRVKVVLDWFIP
jgi:hypothetical protein